MSRSLRGFSSGHSGHRNMQKVDWPSDYVSTMPYDGIRCFPGSGPATLSKNKGMNNEYTTTGGVCVRCDRPVGGPVTGDGMMNGPTALPSDPSPYRRRVSF